MTDKEKLLKNLKQVGVTFPSRQRFTLIMQNGKLGIITIANKSKIKLENEKVFHNQSFMISGEPTALIDIIECENAEQYVDHLLKFRSKWGLDNSKEEEE